MSEMFVGFVFLMLTPQKTEKYLPATKRIHLTNATSLTAPLLKQNKDHKQVNMSSFIPASTLEQNTTKW